VAELTPSERLQPCLLDRITDESPGSSVESRDQRVVSLAQLRRAVLRDLVWLLNCPNKDRTVEFEDYPLAASSVVNFGMPDLAGLSSEGISGSELERAVHAAIEAFEPRLLPSSVEVRALTDAKRGGHNAIWIEIEAAMWAQPMPEQLHLRTEIDLETGQCRIEEGGRG